MGGCTEVAVRDAPEQPEPSTAVPIVNPNPQPTNTKYYTVRQGDTLRGIAAQYNLNYKDVACWNNLREPDYNINSGQRLLLDGPHCRQTAPTTTAVPVVPQTVTPPTVIVKPKPKPQAEESTHVVQEGEQLFVIARRYGKNYRDIAAWNNITPPYNVRIGQVLRLTPPPAGEVSVSKPKHRDPNYHIVLPGDGLSTLARNYRVKFTDLVAWNNLQPPYALSIGQKLRITPPPGSTSSSRVTPKPPRTTSKPPRTTSKPPRTSGGSSSASTSSEYTVKPGDSFKSIANTYGIAVDELADWNGMGPPYTVYPGLVLKLEPPK